MKYASVYYTVQGGKWKGRHWDNIPCDVAKDEVIGRSALPEGVTAFNVNAKDDRGNLVSSPIIYLEVKKP